MSTTSSAPKLAAMAKDLSNSERPHCRSVFRSHASARSRSAVTCCSSESIPSSQLAQPEFNRSDPVSAADAEEQAAKEPQAMLPDHRLPARARPARKRDRDAGPRRSSSTLLYGRDQSMLLRESQPVQVSRRDSAVCADHECSIQ